MSENKHQFLDRLIFVKTVSRDFEITSYNTDFQLENKILVQREWDSSFCDYKKEGLILITYHLTNINILTLTKNLQIVSDRKIECKKSVDHIHHRSGPSMLIVSQNQINVTNFHEESPKVNELLSANHLKTFYLNDIWYLVVTTYDDWFNNPKIKIYTYDKVLTETSLDWVPPKILERQFSTLVQINSKNSHDRLLCIGRLNVSEIDMAIISANNDHQLLKLDSVSRTNYTSFKYDNDDNIIVAMQRKKTDDEYYIEMSIWKEGPDGFYLDITKKYSDHPGDCHLEQIYCTEFSIIINTGIIRVIDKKSLEIIKQFDYDICNRYLYVQSEWSTELNKLLLIQPYLEKFSTDIFNVILSYFNTF
jgi:hypothetical protein